MNERIAALREFIVEKRHHGLRTGVVGELAGDFRARGLAPVERVSCRLVRLLDAESPVILENERIVLTRTVPKLPALFEDAEWKGITAGHFIHEKGNVCNICPDYASTIRVGLGERRREAADLLAGCAKGQDDGKAPFLTAVVASIDAVVRLCGRYRAEAERLGRSDIAEVLTRVPVQGATTFREALQFFRILHFTLWCEGEYHNTVGRFDQFMFPYLKADMEAGRLDRGSALELVEEFFLSFNRDSDLYPGVQQGDNGQSLVLGGMDAEGRDGFNLLSELCLEASGELMLIDPKINLRVNSSTGSEIYRRGTELTKKGLGFPQYSNDDVVIPGLVSLGYAPEDARNYVVAACWEFIIPGAGMDIPNIGAFSFPAVVDSVMRSSLAGCADFGAFMAAVKAGIAEEAGRMASAIHDLWMVPAPFYSILMDGCLASGRDISLGARYNNFGFHGTGLSTAVDSLAAIETYVFEKRSVSPSRILSAVKTDFEGEDDLLHTLRYDAPKFGNNDEMTNGLATELLAAFSDALAGLKNERGGRFRAGTGSAMYYLWHANEIGASPDGRRKGEPFSANYSPSLFAKLKGPISVIQSFTAPDLKRTINGGPLTLEFHSTLFRDEESIRKVGDIVRTFIVSGGHQLQLNAVNKESLLDAQRHPDKHRGLIVRVWGWSAYFIELDREYQEHIISRQEY
jgi:pyruvate-formate lyase